MYFGRRGRHDVGAQRQRLTVTQARQRCCPPALSPVFGVSHAASSAIAAIVGRSTSSGLVGVATQISRVCAVIARSGRVDIGTTPTGVLTPHGIEDLVDQPKRSAVGVVVDDHVITGDAAAHAERSRRPPCGAETARHERRPSRRRTCGEVTATVLVGLPVRAYSNRRADRRHPSWAKVLLRRRGDIEPRRSRCWAGSVSRREALGLTGGFLRRNSWSLIDDQASHRDDVDEGATVVNRSTGTGASTSARSRVVPSIQPKIGILHEHALPATTSEVHEAQCL